MRRVLLTLLMLSFGWIATSWVWAQDVRETEQVLVVEIPVQVFRRNKPLTGLEKDNFRLYDNDKLQSIQSVDVFDFGDIAHLENDGALVEENQRRHFLYFFDLHFASMPHIRRAVDSVRDTLYEVAGPDDRFAVCVFLPNTGPIWLVGFAEDQLLVEAALDAVEWYTDPRKFDELTAPGASERPGVAKTDRSWFYGGNYLAERNHVGLKLETRLEAARESLRVVDVNDEASKQLRDMLGEMTTHDKISTPRVDDDAVISLFTDLSLMAYAMRELPGAKYMVLFSGGFSAPLAGSSVYGNMNQSHGNSATDIIKRLGWQIHAINIAGLRGGGGHTGLNMLAEDTGGYYYRRFNDLDQAMGRLYQNTATTYLLTYQPNNVTNDGSYHEVEVELVNAPRRAKIHYHRPGYNAPYRLQKQAPPSDKDNNP